MTSTALYYVYQKIYDGHCTNIYRRKKQPLLNTYTSTSKRTIFATEHLFDVKLTG